MNHHTTPSIHPTQSRAEALGAWHWGLALWACLWLLACLWGPDLLHHLGVSLDVHGHRRLPGQPLNPPHPFADHRSLWGLPHALDVLSNLPFAVVGLWGMARSRQVPLTTAARASLNLLWWGMVLTGVGSACYHWAPSATSLVADRMGMAIGFAGMLSLPLAANLPDAHHRKAWVGLCVAGLWSAVLPWSQDNVAPWLVLQLGGMAWLTLVAMRPAKPRHGLPVSYGGVVLFYGLAKLLELHDADVWHWSGHWVAGHSLKHLMASAAVLPVLWALNHCGRMGRHPTPKTHLSMPASSTATTHTEAASNQFTLLTQRRFAPFFWVQFLGAGNDNVFKFAFTVLVTYQLQVSWLPPTMAGLVIGALFIAPYLFFSATSGQLADKYPKEVLIRFVKSLEIGIMGLAGWGFVQQNVPVLLGCVFLMGLHSTLFGPVKFAYLPQHLSEREITGGNGMVEMGTFVAILLGNVAGGLLIAVPQVGPTYVAGACMALAILGRVLAQAVPTSPATDPSLRINWNPVTETWRNLRLAHGNLVVFRSLLGISWMWFFGAVFLSQFPSFARDVLHGNEQVASLLLVVFSVGIGVGALLCELLSHRHVEIGLVPMGAIGMTVFAVDLYLSTQGLPSAQGLSLGAFLAQPAHWRVLLDLALLSMCTGIYSVPMYALIQMRSQPTHRARIIAANNILNALFMIASSVLAGALLHAGFSIGELFLLMGLANAVVAFYIFLLVPEYLLRFVAWVLSRLVYRYRVRGDEHIPTAGPAVLACNHVSFVDAVLLMAASPRPIRFLMDHRIFKVPVLGWLFRLAKAIPIAPQKEDAAAYEAAFSAAAQTLREGDLLGIFPEGGITRDGQLQPFKGGVVKILERAQADQITVPVIPMALTQLWGSFFSRAEVRNGEPVAMVRPFRRGVLNRIGLNVGAAMSAQDVTPETLRLQVSRLMEEGGHP